MTETKRSTLGTVADLTAFWEDVLAGMTEEERAKREAGLAKLREALLNHVPARRRLPDGTLERTRAELEAEVERLRKYAGFLRSVIRCGERLPDEYSIVDFERTVTANGR